MAESVVYDFGWMNAWREVPIIVRLCHEAKHVVSDVDPSGWGLTHTVRCDVCGYVYRYDSSG